MPLKKLKSIRLGCFPKKGRDMLKETDFLTVREIADYLNLKELAVYRLLKERKLEHFKFGRQIRVKKDDFDQFLQASRVSRAKDHRD
jgi:excisionase family DNA binding protein